MFPRIVNVTIVVKGKVDLPAIDNLVAYWREQQQRDDQATQDKIDALTAQVQQLTGGLKQSTDQLAEEIQKENTTT